MAWLNAITALLSIVRYITKYLNDRQLILAGQAISIAKNLQGVIDAVERAKAYRASVKHDDDSIMHDPDNRHQR